MNSNFFKSIVAKVKNHSAGLSFNIVRDWQMILATFFTVFIIIAFLCWRLNQTVVSSEDFSGTTDRTSITINRTLMDKVINFYKNQEDLFNQSKTEPVDQFDPSE